MALQVFGFYNGLDENAKGYRYFLQYGSQLDYIALFQISILPNGELSGEPSRRLIQEAHRRGIKVLIVISNLTRQGSFSSPLLSRLTHDQGFAYRVLQNIRTMLRSYQADGVNFDLEKALPEDRIPFANLLESWTNQLRSENYLVMLDVPAQIKDEPTDEWKGAFHYPTLGRINFNGIVLMTYEEHWPGSDPGSVASLPWDERVVDYALASGIPAWKLFLGIPLYGYDWTARGKAQVIGRERAIQVARRYGAPIQWDEDQHSAYFRYTSEGQNHTVYFEELRSLREKINLARRRDLGGIALWEMNLSYPDLWTNLQSYLNP